MTGRRMNGTMTDAVRWLQAGDPSSWNEVLYRFNEGNDVDARDLWKEYLADSIFNSASFETFRRALRFVGADLRMTRVWTVSNMPPQKKGSP